jgi:DNA polymerase I
MKGECTLKTLKTLQSSGYKLEVSASGILYESPVDAVPDPALVASCLNDLRRNKALVRELLTRPIPEHKNVIAIDIEVDGNTIRLISWSDGKTSGAKEDISSLANILKDPTILKVFHNALFDVPLLLKKGFIVSNYTDTMVLAQIGHNRIAQENSLADLSRRYLGIQLNKTLQAEANWEGELTEAHYEYSRRDAEATYQLYHFLTEQLEDRYLEGVARREIAALPAAVHLQMAGIPFDYEGWKGELQCLEAEQLALQRTIELGLSRGGINLRSSQQLKEALLQLGIPVQSTADEELAKHEGAHPVIKRLRRYKKIQKTLSAYGEKLRQQIGPDGRIRGKWRLLGANTSRMTCSQPSLQNLPSIAKPYVKAPSGRTLVIADYSQIELRVIAQLANEERMIESFRSGEDLHYKTASLILGKPVEEVTPEERKIAKTTNFGLLYGMQAYGLMKRIQSQCGIDISLEMATTFRNGYFSSYPAILRFQDHVLQADRFETLGGRYWCPGHAGLKKGAIQRLNYPVQATAAEGFKEALALLIQRLPSDWLLIVAVHDELVLEVPEEQAEEAATFLATVMKEGMSRLIDKVPIEVDVRTSPYWNKG